MKNMFLKVILPLLACAGALVAAEVKEEKAVSPQYNHRMTVFTPAHIGYEYMPNDDFYFGVDAAVHDTYNIEKRNTAMPAELQIRMGRSYFFGGKDHVRPIMGGAITREMTVRKFHGYSYEFDQWVVLDELQPPAIAYGFLGVMLEREFNDRVALGLNVKGLVGGVVGKCNVNQRRIFGVKDVYYGADVSLPFTIRLGQDRHWDIRIEPFALVLNDGNRYLGHRSAVAYRF